MAAGSWGGGMTAAKFERRVRFWQKRMLLSDWKITVEFGPIDCKADCDAKPEYREALLRFDPDRIPDDEVDAYCAHELAHAVNWTLEGLAENSIRSNDEKGYDVVRTIAETVATKWEEIVLNLQGRR